MLYPPNFVKKSMIQIGLLFGGKSTEHEISLRSAKNVYQNLDKSVYDITLIYLSKEGGWFRTRNDSFDINTYSSDQLIPLELILHEKQFFLKEQSSNTTIHPDVIFPVLHGPNGEDGSVQGLLQVANIPFVGPGILGSAAAMDKDVAKRLMASAGLPVTPDICIYSWEIDQLDYNEVNDKIGYPLVVKPANAGSSIGITKVKQANELKDALDNAALFDHKILLEKYLQAREIEIAVLGNENPIASIPGEIVSEFYDYKEKYSDESKTRLDAPAQNLSSEQIDVLQNMAIKAFKSLACEGMSRVDFFLTSEKVYINEVNTIPGFTNISMYPKLFEISGISQKDLTTQLIDLAISRFEKKRQLKSYL